ncbi:MAG: TetR/AcrR family transcriptional regulator [Ilumatobacteraceae bacterium]
MTDTVEDGRTARSRRTREAVIEALLALYAEGNLTPRIEDIASRVGMTSRSVYHHFQDRDAIAVALAEHQISQYRELFVAHPFSGSLRDRVAALVAHRAELFEAVAPVRRAALANMHASPEIHQQQTNFAARLRRQLTQSFESELTALDRGERAETVELLDLHTSWDTWERLRRWQGLSVRRSRQIVTHLVDRALDPAVNGATR